MSYFYISQKVEAIARERDKVCVYCGKEFIKKGEREHIINDAKLNGEDNIAICCGSCNRSKSNKTLQKWFKTPYCKSNNINYNTVAPIVKSVLDKIKSGKIK